MTGEKMDNVFRSVKNISNVTTFPVNLINVYEVVKHETLIFTKDAVEKLEARIMKQESSQDEKVATQNTAVKSTTKKSTVKKGKTK